jgi:hypothetical protein
VIDIEKMKALATSLRFCSSALMADDAADAILALLSELEAREADRQRLDSGCIMTHEWNEFGEEYQCERRGLDLRARIDAALAQRQEGEDDERA